MCRLVLGLSLLLASPAFAQQQQPDPAKIMVMLKQQREMAMDAVASCSVTIAEQQARISELEKQVAEIKK